MMYWLPETIVMITRLEEGGDEKKRSDEVFEDFSFTPLLIDRSVHRLDVTATRYVSSWATRKPTI